MNNSISIENFYKPDSGIKWESSDFKIPPDRRIVAYIRNPEGIDQIAHGNFKQEVNFYQDVRGGKPPLFVSYYTKDTPYEELAHELRNSLDKFDLPHRIEGIESRGSWVANTCLKSNFIAKVWEEYDGPICWIDADAEIIRPPTVVFDNPFNIAMVRRDNWYDASGFVYLDNSKTTGQLIREWVQLCEENPNVWDQALLTLAWYKTAQYSHLSSLWLPQGFFKMPRPWIRDFRDQLIFYPLKLKFQPYISQKQASRKLKAFINESSKQRDELGSDNITQSFRKALICYDYSHETGIKDIISANS